MPYGKPQVNNAGSIPFATSYPRTVTFSGPKRTPKKSAGRGTGRGKLLSAGARKQGRRK